MLRLIFIVFSFLLLTEGLAQNTLDYKTVNDSTLFYYQKGEHTNLVKFTKKAEKEGFDFYYLNARIGLSYFKNKNFASAKKYLEQANKQYPNDYIKTHLYYTLVELGEVEIARNYLHQLSNQTLADSIELGKQEFHTLSFTGGFKTTSLQDSIKTLRTFRLGLGHKFSNRFYLKEHFDYTAQNYFYGKLKQFELGINSYLTFKRSWLLGIGGGFNQIKLNFSAIDSSYTTTKVNSFYPPGALYPVQDTAFINGISTTKPLIRNNTFFLNLRAKKSIGRINIQPAVAFIHSTIKLTSEINDKHEGNRKIVHTLNDSSSFTNYLPIDTLIHDTNDSTISNSIIQFNLSLEYRLPIFKNKLKVQFGVCQIFDNSEAYSFFNTGILANWMKNFSTAIRYTNGNLFSFYDFQNEIFLNYADKLVERWQLDLNWSIKRKAFPSLIVIHERRTETLSQAKYGTYGAFLSFIIKI